jgi:hypothetical protein
MAFDDHVGFTHEASKDIRPALRTKVDSHTLFTAIPTQVEVPDADVSTNGSRAAIADPVTFRRLLYFDYRRAHVREATAERIRTQLGDFDDFHTRQEIVAGHTFSVESPELKLII